MFDNSLKKDVSFGKMIHLFLLSGIAIVHFDDMQKTYPFTYLPNKMSIW